MSTRSLHRRIERIKEAAARIGRAQPPVSRIVVYADGEPAPDPSPFAINLPRIR
jgi:hypothetical protein